MPPKAAARATNVWPPRVLDTIYRDRIQTLYDLLLDLLTRPFNGAVAGADPPVESSTRTEREDARAAPEPANKELSTGQLEKEEAQKILTREDETWGYVTMLRTSYAVMPETAPTLGPVSFEQRWTQQQIVDRVIELQFRQEAKPSHVLCSGYRKLRPSLLGPGRRRAPVGLESVSGNAAVDIVNSESWRTLHSRVGDLVMLHILSHAAIFTRLPNDCLMQVSGVPISSSVSVFRKSSLLHTGEKMLRSNAKGKLVSQTYSEQPGCCCAKKGKKQGTFEGPSPCIDGTVVKKPLQVVDPTCKLGDDSRGPNKRRSCNMLQVESKSVDDNDKCSVLAQTSCVIRRRHWAKRKAQEDVVCGDSKILPIAENHSPERRKRRKVESHVQESKSAENCGEGLKTEAVASRLLGHGREGNVHHQTSNSHPPSKDSGRFRKAALNSRGLGEQNIRRKINNLIPIATPSDTPRKNSSLTQNDAGGDSVLLTERTACTDNSFLGSEDGSRTGGACPSLPDASRTKRVRPPSWKRRKMRQGQEVRHQQSPVRRLQSHIGERTRIRSVEGPTNPRGDDQTSHDSFQVLQATPCGRQASGTQAAVTSGGLVDVLLEQTACPTEHELQSSKDSSSRRAGPSQMLINRAAIFYNSNFSCHPGLPAKHILNRTKADDTGADHLHAAIFGCLKNMSACSSMDPNIFVDKTPTRSIRVLLKRLLAKARRCAFARLLSRHCPLPQELNSQLAESYTPFMTAATAPLPESQNGSRNSQFVADKLNETENVEQHSDGHSPEVEEVMKLLLGPLYQPSGKGITKSSSYIDSGHEAYATSIPLNGEQRVDANKKTRFPAGKHEKDFADASGTPNVVTSGKALRAGLVASYTDHSSVVSFLWAACRSIVPPEMLGSKRGWRILRRTISDFVSLRRHEKYNLQHALLKFKLSSHEWLSVPCSASESATFEVSKARSDRAQRVLQQRKLELWLYWFFTNLVVPLIRCHFYVTEIENHRQNVFYYRKPVWAKLRNIALKDLTQRNFKKLSKKSIAEALEGKALGLSQVRLLPKRTGVRPIANLAAPSQGTLKFRVKAERRPTLRQLFGNIEKAILPCEAESLKECNSASSVVGDKTLVDPSKHFSPQKSGQISVIKESNLIKSETAHQCLTRAHSGVGAGDRPVVDSFTDFSPQKSWESAGNIQNHLASPTHPYQNLPRANTITTESPGGASSRTTTPCKDVVPLGGLKSFRVQRKSVKSVNYSFRSVNSVLRDAYFCLKLEKDSYPEDLGSSVFGYSDIHSKVLPFILRLKGSGAVPRLYMVVCDVTKAYDTIQQEKLLEIVTAYLRSSDYKVAKYTSVTPTLGSVRVCHGRAPTRACEHQNFAHLVHHLATKHSHCIFTDQGLCSCVRREKILVLLEEHLKHNIVQMGKQFYQQTVGIPQGSTLSSILCSLFYGHFELHRLMPHLQSRLSEKLLLSSKHTAYLRSACCTQPPQNEILASKTMEVDVEHMLESSFGIWTQASSAVREEGPSARCNPHCTCPECRKSDHHDSEMASSVLKNSILLRLIDDSFFISVSEAAATIFAESMHMGSSEYGCHANKRKTAASFSLQLGNILLPKKIYTTEDGACFMRWSGLLINCYTMEFQADYTRYSGEHIRSTLTVKRERNQGWHLVLKMCQYMRPKCHALFFDPRINSPATIRLNAFQAFLLCAMKFHAYVCCLPRAAGHNQSFLYEVICCTTRYMYGLLRHRMETVGAKAVEYFPFVELEWLALVAFHRILKRKQSRYRMLLQILQTQLETPKYTKMTSCPHLSSATDEKRSSMFKYIKY